MHPELNLDHARSREQLKIKSAVIKGETPVIYFYTDQAQKVRVDVGFPHGIWTQWYPQAQIVGPQFAQMPKASELKDGRIRWCADLIPAKTAGVAVRKSADDASAAELWVRGDGELTAVSLLAVPSYTECPTCGLITSLSGRPFRTYTVKLAPCGVFISSSSSKDLSTSRVRDTFAL